MSSTTSKADTILRFEIGKPYRPIRIRPSIAKPSRWRYGTAVPANSGAGFDGPSNLAHKRPIRQQALFLCLPFCVMAAVRGAPSGAPGSKFPVRQPAHSCHPNRLTAIRGSSKANLEHHPMKQYPALNPSALQQRAAAHRAMALAALRADSSLSVRLSRYNAHMSNARTLESQEVAQ